MFFAGDNRCGLPFALVRQVVRRIEVSPLQRVIGPPEIRVPNRVRHTPLRSRVTRLYTATERRVTAAELWPSTRKCCVVGGSTWWPKSLGVNPPPYTHRY